MFLVIVCMRTYVFGHGGDNIGGSYAASVKCKAAFTLGQSLVTCRFVRSFVRSYARSLARSFVCIETYDQTRHRCFVYPITMIHRLLIFTRCIRGYCATESHTRLYWPRSLQRNTVQQLAKFDHSIRCEYTVWKIWIDFMIGARIYRSDNFPVCTV